MHATRNNEVYGKVEALYVSQELSLKTWKLVWCSVIRLPKSRCGFGSETRREEEA